MSCPSRIRHWDLNPQPLEREYPPITTRPGLPPSMQILLLELRIGSLTLSAKDIVYSTGVVDQRYVGARDSIQKHTVDRLNMDQPVPGLLLFIFVLLEHKFYRKKL